MMHYLLAGMFCATAGTIVSGAMAERTNILGFCIFTFVMTAIVYPIVVHWTWSGAGFLNYSNKDGESVTSFDTPFYKDFAGSGIVHMVGGVAAAIGAKIVGPRNGRFDKEREAEFAPHNLPLVVLGTLILWFGWYGFNPGSTLALSSASDAYSAARVAVNTTLSAAAGGLTVLGLRYALTKKADVGGFCNGILAGLVAVTAGCGFVDSGESVAMGVIGGLVYNGASALMIKLEIDDPLDAFAVHGATGAWGVFATGLFGDERTGGCGAFYDHDESECDGGKQLGAQIVGILVIAAWTAAWSLVLFGITHKAGMSCSCEAFRLIVVFQAKSLGDTTLDRHPADRQV